MDSTMNNPETTSTEQGQILIMFVLLLTVLILFVAMVIDVGVFMQVRARTQHTADAAALAGVQELPDDVNLARLVALDYVERNGLDPDTVDITFRCTSDLQQVCDEAAGIYDTISVTPQGTAAPFFGGVLRLVGGDDLCWVGGCSVMVPAVACKGACGPISTGPLDFVMVLDHSYSMSNSDLNKAKNAVRHVFTQFNHEFQRVSLAVTPPVTPENLCDSIDQWTDPQVWLPAPLTDSFQASPHSLNPQSPPVSVLSCLDRTDWPGGELQVAGGHTDLGSPLKAAIDELEANGRPEVVWGIVLLTDGAANTAPALNSQPSTGEHFCASQAPVTSGSGDNNGYEEDASDACANGGGYARDIESGTSNSSSCGSNNKDRHDFWDFGVQSDIPSGATIEGIEIRLDAWEDADEADLLKMCVELSWDGGSSWTSANSFNVDDSQSTYIIGNNTDTWGHGWTRDEMSDATFRVRITNVADDSETDFRLDAVAVNVFYADPSSSINHLGPCDWAVQQAAAAKTLGIEVFAIGWGVSSSDRCSQDSASSPYYNMSAADFLRLLATDDAHFYNEPKNKDLDPIFNAIGGQLTQGTRLIE